jgi:hypothetical protein
MSNVPAISVSDAMASPLLFEPFFRGASWDAWRAMLKAAFAEPTNDTEKAVLAALGARQPPAKRIKELICCWARRRQGFDCQPDCDMCRHKLRSARQASSW